MGYRKKKKSNPSKIQKFKNLRKKRKEAFKQQSKKVLKKPPNAPGDSEKKDPKHSYANDRSLTFYDGVWVKQDAVAALQSLKAELTKKNLSHKKVKLIMMKAKRKANRKVQTENKLGTTENKPAKKKEEKTEDKEEEKTEDKEEEEMEDKDGDVVME
ncbi:nucleolar protein 58-like [Palaemon carinicauda]|uniref:nucleolar protein 58-like n=1 Tax=Palaemon carinicauda TaxID=392227 RepID=UPI0035B5D30B